MKKSVMSLTILFAFCNVPAALSQTVSPTEASTPPASIARPASTNGKVSSRLTRISSTSLQPITDAYCRANLGFPCYSPQEIYNAYGLTPFLKAGFNGTGQTIVIIDAFGSPTITQDLQAFDAGFGLPDPPSFTVLTPLGTVPFDPNNQDQVAWAGETTQDVELAHTMAPGADIVLLTSPVDQTEGVQGLPELLKLERYALEHKLGQIISQSWVATENTLFGAAGQKVINDFEDFYQQAANDNITVFAGTGDGGTANLQRDLKFYSFPTVNFPASSPFVTAVGGTSLYADTSGNYQYEIGWGNPYSGASGGGVSQQFSEPSYQYSLPASVQATLNNHRGLPDVAFNGDVFTPEIVYLSFFGPQSAGFYAAGGGTSAGAPAWSGLIADINQLIGRPLGFLNPKLYAIGERAGSFHDITFGSNAQLFNGVSGYSAGPGWDFVTGWGTPDLNRFIWELARQ